MTNLGNATLLPTGTDPDSHFPHRYRPSKPEGATAEEILDATVVPFRQKNNRVVVWSIPIDGKPRDTSKPIILKNYEDGDFWFSENVMLNIVGTGKSPDKAIDDAKEHIAYFFSYYLALRDDEVIGAAVQLKNTYKYLFSPN